MWQLVYWVWRLVGKRLASMKFGENVITKIVLWLWYIMVKSRPQLALRNHVDQTGNRVTQRNCKCQMAKWRLTEGLKVGKMSVQIIIKLYGKMGKDLNPYLIQPFLETINKQPSNGKCKPFQCFTIGPLLWRWLLPWRTLNVKLSVPSLCHWELTTMQTFFAPVEGCLYRSKGINDTPS